jgi:hypothetical protein
MTYFHGTDADLEIGDILLPGSKLSTTRNYGRSEHVYLTTDSFDAKDAHDIAVREALAWARTACMVAEDEGHNEDPFAFVYIVEPIGEVESDGSEDVGEEAVRCGSARIVGMVDYETLLDYLPAYGKSYLN